MAVLREIVAAPKKPIDWKSLREQTLWGELVACLLGSAVRFEDAICAVTRLKNTGVLTSYAPGRSLQRFERRVAEVLTAPCTRNDGCIARYRFPHRRAALVRMAAAAVYSSGHSLKALLKRARSARHARELLVTTVPGIGPKQASLFLRNIGFSNDLAILDVHVLRYLSWLRGTTLFRRPSLSSIRQYEKYERRIDRYAQEVQVTVGELDLAVWVTARAAADEGIL
jgi:N-glycosylase/DNA lyase